MRSVGCRFVEGLGDELGVGHLALVGDEGFQPVAAPPEFLDADLLVLEVEDALGNGAVSLPEEQPFGAGGDAEIVLIFGPLEAADLGAASDDGDGQQRGGVPHPHRVWHVV
jgi:hypothetical protein